MYETHAQPPLQRPQFVARLARHGAAAVALLAVSLGIGIAGYMAFEQLGFVDALLNAAMLLGGMGPVNPPQSTAGKLFASAYALYAGLFFIVTAAILLTPVLHRVLHRLHWSGKG